MTYVAGVFLGIVVGFAIAMAFARRRPGGTRLGRGRTPALAIVALALVAGSIVLARRDHGERGHLTPAASTTTSTGPSTTAAPTSTTGPHAVVNVPNLIGKTRAAALATLRNLLLHPIIQTLPTSSVPPGFVLSQNPVTESLVPEGSAVSLVISAAP